MMIRSAIARIASRNTRLIRAIGASILFGGSSLAFVSSVMVGDASAADITNDYPVSTQPNAGGSCGEDSLGTWASFSTGGSAGTFTKNANGGGSYSLTFEQTADSPARFRIISLTDTTGTPALIGTVVLFFGGNDGRGFDFDPPAASTGADYLKVSTVPKGGSNITQMLVCAYPPQATFTVKKVVTYEAGTTATLPDPDPATFDIAVTCTAANPADPAAPFNWASTPTVSLAPGQQSATIQAPAGTTCTATDSVAGYVTTATTIVLDSSTATIQQVVVTNSKQLPTRTLRVTKDIVGAVAGDPAQFVVRLACTDSTGATVDLDTASANTYLDLSLADLGTGSVTVPKGSTCTITEPALDTARWTATIPAPVLLDSASTTPVDVTVVNQRRFGSVQVHKTFVTNGDTTPTPFTFTASCVPGGTFTGSLSTDGTVVLDNAGSQLVPAGAVCTVTESTNAQWTGSAAPASFTVAADTTSQAEFTNTRNTGALVIRKTVEGAAAGETPTFTYAVDCGRAGDPVSVTVATNGTSGSSTPVTGLLTGTTCTVTEQTLANWTQTAPANGAPATATIATGNTTVDFTNVRQTSNLVITKAIVDPSASGATGAFQIDVSCAGQPVTGSPFTLDNIAGTTPTLTVSIPGIPAGTSCTVSETPPTGWRLEGIAPSATITTSAGGNNITVTNTRLVGAATVTKAVDGGGPGGAFTFALDCASTGYHGTAQVTLAAGATSGTASFTPAIIPTATDCVASEATPPSGYTSAAAQTGISITADGTAEISFANHYVAADVSVVKTAPESVVAGAPLSYTITVSNLDDVDTATAVTLTDVLPAGVLGATVTPGDPTCTITGSTLTCTWATLAPGSSQTVTVAGTADSTLVGGANITNGASITSTTPDPNSGNNTSSVTTTVSQSADLGITKTGPGVVTPGATAVYTVTLTNGGPSTATNVQWLDTPTGVGTCTTNPVSTTVASLAPGASATWTVSCGPVAAGLATVTNVAAVTQSSLTSNGDPTTAGELPDTASVTSHVASFTFTKRVSPGSYTAAGQPLLYTLTLTNTGGATLSGITLTDPNLTGPVACTLDGASFDLATGTLVPGKAIVCTATVTTTAADVTAGQIVNTATADTAQTSPAAATATATFASYTFTKSTDTTFFAEAGQQITYRFSVVNTGTAPLTGIVITDPKITGPLTCTVSGAPFVLATGSLAGGATLVCTATYTTTPDDVVGKAVVNTASVVTNQTTTPISSTVTVPFAQIAVVKSVSPTTFSSSGQPLTYTFTITNSGGAALTGITVTDPKITGPITCTRDGVAFDLATGSLAVGKSLICTAAYTTTPADVTAGSVTNTVVVDSTQSGPDSAEAIALLSSVVFTKTASPTSVSAAGQTVTYTFTIANAGQAPLTGITLSDPMLSGAYSCTVDGASFQLATGSLPVGKSLICTATHVVTASELANGTIVNTASVVSDQTTTPITATATVKVAALTFTKSVDRSSFSGPDQTLTYTLLLTNTGQVPLTGLSIVDPKVASLQCTLNGAPFTVGTDSLPVDGVLRCVGAYATTAADVAAGRVDNEATADSAETDAARAQVTTPYLAGAPAAVDLQLTKAAVGSGTPGGQLSWSITITNLGPGAATGVYTVDTLPAGLTYVSASGTGWTCSPSGQSITCTNSAALPANATLPVLTITTQIAAGTTSSVSNTASVGSSLNDPNPANNTSTARGTLVGLPVSDTNVKLPTTGTDSRRTTIWSLGIALFGAVLLLASRRRPRTEV